MVKKTICERIVAWCDSTPGQASRERKLKHFRNAPTLEGIIVNKHFIPDQESGGGLFSTYNYSPKECILGVELNDSSKKVFHYYGSRAEEIYLFNQKGDKVSFKQDFMPYDTEETIYS